MPGNRKLQRNGEFSDSPKSSMDKAEEGMRRLKIDKSDVNGDDDPGAYPDRPGEPDCIYYLRTGTCGYGSNCRFNHPSNGEYVYGAINTTELPERDGQPECGFYLKTGTCKYGSTCKYHHPKERQGDSLVLLNIVGLPMREDSKPCLYYMRTGLCKYGFACKFHHPQPTSPATNVLPTAAAAAAAAAAYGTYGGLAAVPSSGSPSVGEISSASLSKGTYVSSSSLQLQQSYVPYMLSPSQGWNSYMGSVNPLSVTSVLTAPASTGSYLPERPDQPECRYFMNNGSCKYGSDCKYHHPREKIAELAATAIGPLGLPLRPGQPVCSYYGCYGLCKYGPSCKFDHPIDGYSYAYNLSVPSLPTPYMTPISYQKMPSFVPSSNYSPSKSSNLGNWIEKGAASASNTNQDSNTKSPGDSPDKPESLTQSYKTDYNLIHYESDESI